MRNYELKGFVSSSIFMGGRRSLWVEKEETMRKKEVCGKSPEKGGTFTRMRGGERENKMICNIIVL